MQGMLQLFQLSSRVVPKHSIEITLALRESPSTYSSWRDGGKFPGIRGPYKEVKSQTTTALGHDQTLSRRYNVNVNENIPTHGRYDVTRRVQVKTFQFI